MTTLKFVNAKNKAKKILIEFDENDERCNSDLYSISRAPYVNSEFIPSNMISIVINHFFPSSELILSYSENHGVYKILIDDLLGDAIKNWTYNRPPDMERCPEIARYIYNSKKPFDTMIYLSFCNKTEVFEVLDGIHRLTALKIIKEENSKPLELLCPGEFGSDNNANWLFKQYILVNIRFNSTQGELIEVFKNLNKSQTVPELYIRDTSREKRDIIDTIANEWYVLYKRHFSSAANPIRGNTNRNKFVELLDVLYDKYKIDSSNVKKLITCLKNANAKCGENIHSKVSVDIRLKCKETGCYLFLHKNDVLKKII
jgi:hypothetical protein